MFNSKISFIIPVYNSEQYLERCLNSLINQTEKNIEVIIIDDGSIDMSSEIIDNFSKIDRRINAVHKNNEGVSIARNIGIKLAKSEYIMFLDADDWLAPNAAEIMYESIIDSNSDLLICENIDVYEDGTQYIEKSLFKEKIFIQKRQFKNSIYPVFIEDNKLDVIWKFLIRKKIILDNNIFFDTSMALGEDTLFSYELLTQINSLIYIPDALHYYYKHNSGLSGEGVKYEMAIHDSLRLNTKFIHYCELWDLVDSVHKENMYIKIFNNVFGKFRKAIFNHAPTKFKQNYVEWMRLLNTEIVKQAVNNINLNSYYGKYRKDLKYIKRNLKNLGYARFQILIFYCYIIKSAKRKIKNIGNK